MSSHQPPDCTLQVPSWDEFDQTEELDYSEHEPTSEGEELHEPGSTGNSLSPANFCLNSDPNEAVHSPSVPNYENQNQEGATSASSLDQLPNSVSDYGREQRTASRPIGPSLPPGFLINTEHKYEEDPEDPGDPEDPDEGDSCGRVPSMNPQEASTSFLPGLPIASCSGQIGQIGPSLPAGYANSVAPTLPDDEFRPNSYETLTMPPPEPEEARISAWSSKKQVNGSNHSERTIGPVFPDVLPLVAKPEVSLDYDESYGPVVPPDLFFGPSTSSNYEMDLEMPVQGDEHLSSADDNENDDDFIGPVPPCDQNSESIKKAYNERLAEFQALQDAKKSNVKREEWMVKLPKKLNNYGLGARKFTKGGGCSNSEDAIREWTEIPSERDSRFSDASSTSAISFEHQRIEANDAVQEQLATSLNSCRDISLLEAHKRKRKLQSTQNDKDGSEIRRPFDRERDMELHGMKPVLDASQIKERCEQLNSRFKHSSQKFL